MTTYFEIRPYDKPPHRANHGRTYEQTYRTECPANLHALSDQEMGRWIAKMEPKFLCMHYVQVKLNMAENPQKLTVINSYRGPLLIEEFRYEETGEACMKRIMHIYREVLQVRRLEDLPIIASIGCISRDCNMLHVQYYIHENSMLLLCHILFASYSLLLTHDFHTRLISELFLPIKSNSCISEFLRFETLD